MISDPNSRHPNQTSPEFDPPEVSAPAHTSAAQSHFTNLHHPPIAQPSARLTTKPKMAFEVEPASPSDAPQMARVFQAAFSNAFNRRMFPPTEDVRAWATEHLVGGGGAQPREVFLKASDEEGKVAAFAKWIRPGSADPDRREDEEVSWPVSSDAELCAKFFGTMEEHHHRHMGDGRHYCMFSFSCYFFTFYPARKSSCGTLIHTAGLTRDRSRYSSR